MIASLPHSRHRMIVSVEFIALLVRLRPFGCSIAKVARLPSGAA